MLNVKFHENLSSWSRLVPCGRTDMTKLDFFSNYEGWNFNSGNYLFTTDTK